MTFRHPSPTPGGASFVLFAEPPEVDAVVAALRTALDAVEVAEADADGSPLDSPVLSGRMGPDTVLAVPIAGPLPPGEAEAACHPVWWDDPSPVAGHTAHVIVVARTEAADPDEDPRTRALHQALATSTATAALVALPGAVGVHAAGAGATFPAREYGAYVHASVEAQRLPSEVWVTTWLDPAEDDTIAGFTQGLGLFGHADLEVRASRRAPSDVYNLLSSLAHHILMTGDSLDPGHTLGWDDGVHDVVESPDSTEAHRVLAIQF